MLSVKPPPVMWASPFTAPVSRIARRQDLTYSRVGVSSAPPSVMTGANGACAAKPRPDCSTILRTSEKPLECTPDEARPITASPAAMSLRGNNVPRSAAPTAKPPRS